jgi:hypothetical protein
VPQAPRHTEVNQESSTAFKTDNQILAAPLDGCDALALKPSCDLVRIGGLDEARVEDGDALEAPTDDRRLELSANRLDLGKLGHAG